MASVAVKTLKDKGVKTMTYDNGTENVKHKEINEAQKKKDIETIKAQDKYDNEWGYIK